MLFSFSREWATRRFMMQKARHRNHDKIWIWRKFWKSIIRYFCLVPLDIWCLRHKREWKRIWNFGKRWISMKSWHWMKSMSLLKGVLKCHVVTVCGQTHPSHCGSRWCGGKRKSPPAHRAAWVWRVFHQWMRVFEGAVLFRIRKSRLETGTMHGWLLIKKQKTHDCSDIIRIFAECNWIFREVIWTY